MKQSLLSNNLSDDQPRASCRSQHKRRESNDNSERYFSQPSHFPEDPGPVEPCATQRQQSLSQASSPTFVTSKAERAIRRASRNENKQFQASPTFSVTSRPGSNPNNHYYRTEPKNVNPFSQFIFEDCLDGLCCCQKNFRLHTPGFSGYDATL
jgi:hypothetical protein